MNAYLASLTDDQLVRLFWRAWRRMTEGDGYQPFGYDWRTLRITKPSWFPVIRTLQDELEKRRLI
jgi:hypothetical protein